MNHPYWLFQQLIRQVCGIVPNEPAESVRDKLAACLAPLTAEARDGTYQVLSILQLATCTLL